MEITIGRQIQIQSAYNCIVACGLIRQGGKFFFAGLTTAEGVGGEGQGGGFHRDGGLAAYCGAFPLSAGAQQYTVGRVAVVDLIGKAGKLNLLPVGVLRLHGTVWLRYQVQSVVHGVRHDFPAENVIIVGGGCAEPIPDSHCGNIAQHGSGGQKGGQNHSAYFCRQTSSQVTHRNRPSS